MRVKFCPNCDKQLAWEAVRCDSCGSLQAGADEEFKECPECAETIKARAKVCRFCGYDLAGRVRAPTPVVLAIITIRGIPIISPRFLKIA